MQADSDQEGWFAERNDVSVQDHSWFLILTSPYPRRHDFLISQATATSLTACPLEQHLSPVQRTLPSDSRLQQPLLD